MNAILTSFTIAALLSLINLGSTVAFNAILSIGAAALLSSYFVTITCVVIKRLRHQPLLRRRWSLGKWGLPINLFALAYLLIAFLFALFPIAIPVTLETMNWASAIYGGVAILACIFYMFYAKHTYIAPVARVVKDAERRER